MKILFKSIFLFLGLFMFSACASPVSEPEKPPADHFDFTDPKDLQEENNIVSIYPFAPGMDKFTDMSVIIHDDNGAHEIELYSVVTNPKRQFPAVEEYFKNAAVAMFDMTGIITVEVVYPAGIENAVIRPARAGISHTVKDSDKIIFEISEWGQYSIEFNGDPETDNLMIFANPPAEIPENAKISRIKALTLLSALPSV